MKKELLSGFLALTLVGSIAAAVPPTFVQKWDLSIATPLQKGLVTLAPGTVVALEPGRTNEVFALLEMDVPEEEKAHRAVSLEFRYRFRRGSSEIGNGVIHTDQYNVFTSAHQPVKPWDHYRPASQELASTETVTIPEGADSLELERKAVDALSGKNHVSKRVTFALVGNEKSLLVMSGDSRGDTDVMPKPYLLGSPITGKKPLTLVFDGYRTMNGWVRTSVSKSFGNGIIATYAGSDIRSMSCVNRKVNVVYYSAWADAPVFELVTRVRFDEGKWEDLPRKRIYPGWSSPVTKDLFPATFDTVPGLFRAADPNSPSMTASIFPDGASARVPPLHLHHITVPADAKSISVQNLVYALFIAHYGKKFEGTPYVGEDCVQLYPDGQRVELNGQWDTPDFSDKTAWTFPVQ